MATILAKLLSDAGVQMVNGEGSKAATATSGQAIVQADPSLNAVIVRDAPERMAMYGKLIAALDKPAARIEVALSIIDINAEDLSQLGVDWRVGIRTGSNQQVIIKTTGDRKGIEGGPRSAVWWIRKDSTICWPGSTCWKTKAMPRWSPARPC